MAGEVKVVCQQQLAIHQQRQELQQQFDALKKLGDEVVGGADARFMVLELLKAIDVALPMRMAVIHMRSARRLT